MIEVDLGCEVIGGASTYLELTDTPSTYAGQAGKFPVVNVGENGIEFTAAVGTGVNSVTGDGVGGTATDPEISFPTPTEIGLGNVNNTSDASKPISTDVQTALDLKEDEITAGTIVQYYRGDKTFQTLNKATIGLGNVDNTSDLNKPISTDTQTGLDGKVGNTTVGEPIGSDSLINAVSLTQAEFDAGTPVATTLYLVTDA